MRCKYFSEWTQAWSISPNFNTNSWSYGPKIHIELKKLSNELFVNNTRAAVVENECQKQAVADARIKVLEEQLKGLK